MSDLGPLAFGKNQQEIFLGRDFATQRDFSEDTAIKIDQEVKRFVMTGYQRAKDILTEGREALVRMAKTFLEREKSMDAAEVKLLVKVNRSQSVWCPRPAVDSPRRPRF